MPTVRIGLIFLLLWVPRESWGQTGPHTPKPQSVERKAILDALRISVERELKGRVVFKVDQLKVQGGWAFLRGVPRRPDGGPFDYRRTPYRDAVAHGWFEDWICALLKTDRGKWRVVRYVIGATDVAYDGWDKRFKAPSSIFK